MSHAILATFVALVVPGALVAQIGGDGRDGPLSPTTNTTLDTSRNGGTFQFTKIHIPSGVTVHVTGPNPAVIHSQGDVDIAGTLSADGSPPTGAMPGAGGPGGFAGGQGGSAPSYKGSPGLGPGAGAGAYTPDAFKPREFGGGGGHASAGFQPLVSAIPGPAYGAAYPFDLHGGSGGGGGADRITNSGVTGGSGGGGVLVILADGAITISGTVSASGGDLVYANFFPAATGGGGAGGSIFLRSLQRLRVTKTGNVLALGGRIRNTTYNSPIPSGGDGFVRLDTYGAMPEITGTVAPDPMRLRIPELRELNPPKIGWIFRLHSAAVPGDVVAVFMAKKSANIPVPPFGILLLDPTAGFIFAGGFLLPASGIDPQTDLIFPVQNDPLLVGLELHIQAINLITATGRPRLTNAVMTTVIR